MTLEQYMEANGGFWDGDFAMVSQGTYVRNLATRHGDKVELSPYGKSVIGDLANTLASKVESGKRRSKQPVAKAEPDDFDDLDL
jgi:hypothetical protein